MNNETIKAKIAEAFAIEQQSAIEAGTVGYMARALVQATMPHKATKELHHVRRNGNYRLIMTANDPEVGLPYGSVPRLLLAWLGTEAVKTKHRELILGDSMSDFMRKLGLVPTGGRWGSIRRLKDQSTRLFDCSIKCSYTTEDQDDRAGGQFNARFLIADADSNSLLWWHRNPDQMGLFDSSVKLSEAFYSELTNNPVPVDLRVLKALSKSPLALDVYSWTVYRIFTLNHSDRSSIVIPWEALQMQFGSGYPVDTAQGRSDFKRKFLGALKKVQLHYPEAKISDSKDGLLLRKSPQHLPSRPL